MKTSLTNEAFFSLQKQALEIEGQAQFQVISGSMQPLIPVGATIKVISLSRLGRPLRRFDIVVFFQQNYLICHLVHHINQLQLGDKKYVTRPLRKTYDDLPISEADILGVVENYKVSNFEKLRMCVFQFLGSFR